MNTLALTFFNAIPSWRPLKRVNAHIRASMARSQTIKELSRLSSKDLEDIGLNKGDIHYLAKEHYNVTFNENLKGWV